MHAATWSMVVWHTQNLRRDGCSFMWHQPCQWCKYTISVDIQKTRYKKPVTHVEPQCRSPPTSVIYSATEITAIVIIIQDHSGLIFTLVSDKRGCTVITTVILNVYKEAGGTDLQLVFEFLHFNEDVEVIGGHIQTPDNTGCCRRSLLAVTLKFGGTATWGCGTLHWI